MNTAFRSWIRGVGMTPFVKVADTSFAELGRRAIMSAIESAGMSVTDIEEVVCGTGYGGPLAGQRIAGPLGLTGRRVTNVENACSSGIAALEIGVEAIESGRAKTVVVLGIDTLSSLGRGALPLSADDVEVQQGAIMPAIYAMRAQRYLHETGATVDDLAAISVKSRRNGALNPYAQMRSPVSVEEVLDARPVAMPLTLLMCCPRGDGAAAAVLSSLEPSLAEPGVGIRAVSVQSGFYTDGFRDMTRSELSERTIATAYRQAEMGPQDMQIAETHDAFSIAEIMYYEALGLADIGQGWRLARSGATAHGGRVVVNPSGGLLSRGHPVGATGIAQVCEAYWQLTEQAGERQVQGARNVITHCTGGGIAGFDHGASGVAIMGRA